MTAAILLILAAAAGDTGVDVRVELEPPIIPFHEQATLTVIVEAPEDAHVKMPNIYANIGDLMASQEDVGALEEETLPAVETRELGNSRVQKIARYTVEGVLPALYPIEPITVEWGDGQKETVIVPPLRIRELTAAEEAEAEQMADIPGPLSPPSPLGPILAWGLGILGVVLAIVALALWWMRQRGEGVFAPVSPPWERAYARLRELDEQQLPAKGLFDEYYVALSSILRQYIEERFHIHAPEQTTQEFLAEAARSGHISVEHQGLLARFMRHCDLVKFAKFEPSVGDMERSFADVLTFVDQTIPKPDVETEAAA